MDSFINRINVIFYSMTICFVILCVVNYGTSFYLFNEKDVSTNIKVRNVKRFVYNKYINADEAVFTLDLSYDMRHAFNWNLKQLFVYVLVTYKTPIKSINEVIIQDYIIENKNDAKKTYKNIIPKYSLKDYSNGLKNNTIQLQVCYKYMPIIGLARSYEGAKITYKLPDEYFDNLPSRFPLYHPDK
ncbi:signal peptidase complex subunit 3, putative [Hepatocystis sp. ex Piliocolobus tephrosceles]|nr:signal peptidase complex subunit 3, putative [Hepatocystis sp. ex Piliocolobus tephrosceles]